LREFFLEMRGFHSRWSRLCLIVISTYVVVLSPTGRITNREDILARALRQDERSVVKAEGNFEDHPYFTVGNQRGGEGIIEYARTIRTRDGQELKQTWTVRAVQGLGLPGTLDQDVYVALLQLIDRGGEIPEDGWVGFSLYKLVELLRRTHGGRDYKQIKESLERLSATVIQSKNAFYRKRKQAYLDKTFHLLEEVRHSEIRDGSGGATERTWVKLSEYFVESYRANYLKGLDVDFYWSLNSSVAKRLYRFVDKKRNQQRRWEVDLFALRDRIPLSRYRYPSKIKEKLEPAHQELREQGFLEHVTYRTTMDGSHLVCYEIPEGFSKRRPQLHLESTPEVRIAVERLRAEGVRQDVAEVLVARFGPERCTRYAEAIPFQKGIRNPAGWLRKAIENGYELDAMPPARAVSLAHEVLRPVGNGKRDVAGETAERPLGRDSGPAPVPPDPGPAALEVWEQLIQELSEDIDAPSPHVWFAGCVPTALQDDILTVVVPNEIAEDYIETRFKEPIEQALQSKVSTTASLRIKVLR
jgi:hypothetical protein